LSDQNKYKIGQTIFNCDAVLMRLYSYRPVAACVCLSHSGAVLKQFRGSGCFFADRFPPTYTTLYFRQNRGFPTITTVPSGTLSQIWPRHANRRKARYKQTTSVGLLFTTLRERRRQTWPVLSTSIDHDRGLLRTFGVQHCMQLCGRLSSSSVMTTDHNSAVRGHTSNYLARPVSLHSA